jgi:hypothetical protein
MFAVQVGLLDGFEGPRDRFFENPGALGLDEGL